MFTEGLNRNSLRRVREKEASYSSSNQGPRADQFTSIRTGHGGRGIGLPPPSKFRSGHLPANAIPVYKAINSDMDEIGSGSEIGTTDSEDEVFGGRYSLDSSPQDKRFHSDKYGNTMQNRPHNGSDYSYSDISSSREMSVSGRGRVAQQFLRKNGRYPIGKDGFTEEESPDSAFSSEFSTTQVGRASLVSEGYASSVLPRVKIAYQKDFLSRNQLNDKVFDDGDNDEDEIPSAPPFGDPFQEIRQNGEQIQASKVQRTNDRVVSQEPKIVLGAKGESIGNKSSDQFVRMAGSEAAASSGSPHIPTFHASSLGPWHAVVAYDACVRLCLHAWAMENLEAPTFLKNECAVLRDAFSLRQMLLQSEDELLVKRTSELVSEGVAPKPKKVIGKMKVQVRKMKMGLDPPTGCSILALRTPAVTLDSVKYRFTSWQSTVASGWQAFREISLAPHMPTNRSFLRQSLAYMQASTQYVKQVSGLLKAGVTTLRNSSSSYEVVQEIHSCLLRMRSSTDEDAIKMQAGSGETHVFFPDGLGDDLIIEIQDSNGKHFGRVLAQVAAIAEHPADKLRWWSVYHEPKHELVGKIQLYIHYSASSDDNSHLKCGSVAETVAYDLVLEVAMKVQHFQQRNLLLHGSWKWLLIEFASYYGISDVYTKLRYLSYVMDVATPTADCLDLVYELLMPVVMKGNHKSTLSHQENRILGETKDQLEQILSLVFENYKSLDESCLSGIMEVFRPATGIAAPALESAVKLYTLLHDILSPEAQTSLCHYFQVAVKKRSRKHLAETDEYVACKNEGSLIDTVTYTTAYQKMKSVCVNVRDEIFTDIKIHNQHILPSFVDLPSLSSSIYSTELCSRLRAFLIACPPTGPSTPVAELVIAAADFQRDLASWGISPVKGGVDAKELFHLYILVWIQDKRFSLLESCRLDKVKWSGVKTQHSTTPFVDEVYDRLKETLSDYEIIICRWPEYTFVLEQAVADVEKAVVEALDRQYADVLAPLKENFASKKFGLKYVQKLAKRNVCAYTVPDELGILLNSMKRMLDVLLPKIETQFKSWGYCIPEGGSVLPGERLSEVTVMVRAKFRNYVQAVVKKLAENTKLQNATKLKKILQDLKETVIETDMRGRMQPLKEQLTNTINHLHTLFENHVFIAVCRGYWDRMGRDVLGFLENRKENRSWYKGSRVAVLILDDTFASQLQQLLGNSLQERDVEPPSSIMEVRSMLCKDASSHKENSYYF